MLPRHGRTEEGGKEENLQQEPFLGRHWGAAEGILAEVPERLLNLFGLRLPLVNTQPPPLRIVHFVTQCMEL